MSAFIVSPDTLNLIVTYGVDNNLFGNAEQTYKTLLRANLYSVNYRYNRSTKLSELTDYKYERLVVSVEQVYMSCGCLNYQSCEYRSWHKSNALKLVNMVTNHIKKHHGVNIRRLNNARWDY